MQALGGNIFVTYATRDAAKYDDVAGGGFGNELEDDGEICPNRPAGRAA
jgi:hypothetical protein